MAEPAIRSLASFDPRFADLLLRGAREAFTLQCESPAQAYRLQMRIQQFRSRSLAASVAGADKLYDCIVSLNKKTAVLTFKPRRDEFGSVLDGLAPATEQLESDPLASLETKAK